MHAGHALDFVRYAATVQGNYEVANKASWKMANMITDKNLMIMQGQKRVSAPWLVLKIFGKWDEILTLTPDHQGTPYLDGIWSYVLGSAHLAKGNMDSAIKELNKLKKLVNSPDADQYRVGATPASAVLRLASFGLEGEILMAKGDLNGAIKAFSSGVEIEDQNNYTEPPDWAQPMRHYLGAALLKDNQASRAESVYRRDLKWNQNNGWSLLGLHQALIAQNKNEEAEEVYKSWEKAWVSADVELTASYVK